MIQIGTRIKDANHEYVVIDERVKDPGFTSHSQKSKMEFLVERQSDKIHRWVQGTTIELFEHWNP